MHLPHKVLKVARHQCGLHPKNSPHKLPKVALRPYLPTIAKIQVTPFRLTHGNPMSHYAPACLQSDPMLFSMGMHPLFLVLLKNFHRENEGTLVSCLPASASGLRGNRWVDCYRLA